VLFTGWGPPPTTHAGPSNLNYGHDNWLYGIVGYSGFNGTVGGERHRFGARGSTASSLTGRRWSSCAARTTTAGASGFSEEGLLFGLDGPTATPSNVPAESRTATTSRCAGLVVGALLGGIAGNAPMFPDPPEKVRQVDYHGPTSHGGGRGTALYTARNYPRESGTRRRS